MGWRHIHFLLLYSLLYFLHFKPNEQTASAFFLLHPTARLLIHYFENNMQSRVLIRFIIVTFFAVTVIETVVSQLFDSSLQSNFLDVLEDSDLIFSSDAEQQVAWNIPMFSDDFSIALSSDSITDDFTANPLQGTSDDIFASLCDDSILRARDGSSCGVTEDAPDVDLLRGLGSGDILWNILEPPTGSTQPDSLPIENENVNENRKETLPGPYDIMCDPWFSFRLCCRGPRVVEEVFPDFMLWQSVEDCERSMTFALSL